MIGCIQNEKSEKHLTFSKKRERKMRQEGSKPIIIKKIKTQGRVMQNSKNFSSIYCPSLDVSIIFWILCFTLQFLYRGNDPRSDCISGYSGAGIRNFWFLSCFHDTTNQTRLTSPKQKQTKNSQSVSFGSRLWQAIHRKQNKTKIS